MAALRRAEDVPPLPWLELSPAIQTLSHLSNVARAARAKRARCSGADLASGLLDLSWLSSVAASAAKPIQREPQALLDGDLRPEAQLPSGSGDVRL
jgi:hypothetical protein